MKGFQFEGLPAPVPTGIARRIIAKRALQAHFEDSMLHSRKSVSEEELARYEAFAASMKSDRGTEAFSFDDVKEGVDGDDQDADVDDLYG